MNLEELRLGESLEKHFNKVHSGTRTIEIFKVADHYWWTNYNEDETDVEFAEVEPQERYDHLSGKNIIRYIEVGK